jgi:5-methylcytosine-specific restriction enzyme subunit McrC
MIPIRNIYYLFLYAWNRFSEGTRVDVGSDTSPDLPNLLARVLVSGVRRQLIRGLDKGYVEVVDELACPRGKFLLQDTVKQSSLASGRVVCQFDELRVDTLQNRILRAAIRRLHLAPDIAAGLAAQLRRLEARLEGVTRVPLSPVLFRSLQVTRSHGQYGLLMDVCRLIMDLSLPDEHGTGFRFYDVLQDETRMSTIFEHFVGNFYRMEQDQYSVGRDIIRWPVVCAVPSQSGYLPAMITDVTLRSAMRTIVIDAKFYKTTFVPSRFGDHPKVRPDHLYQLQSYLEYVAQGPSEVGSEGVLLYPSTNGDEVRLDFQLPRHRIRVWTLDLSRPWRHVHKQLLELIGLRVTGALEPSVAAESGPVTET